MLTTHRLPIVSLVVLFITLSLTPQAWPQETWPRFRGADATGVVPDDPRLPDTWDTEKNVQWKTTIPGWGWGSPIVWGDRVFVSSVHSDDEYERPKQGLYLGQGVRTAPDTVHHWMVYCLSLQTGDVLWKHEAHVGKPTMPRAVGNSPLSMALLASSNHVWASFGLLFKCACTTFSASATSPR